MDEVLAEARHRLTHPALKKPYYVKRVVPPEWGPRMNDPTFWTDVERDEAVAALEQLKGGTWPPPGMAAVHRSRVEARMIALVNRGLDGFGRDHPPTIHRH